MSISVYDYSSYKQFILDWIEASPNNGRGLRAQIAEAVGCQVAYVSHVLAADRDFSLEQAEALTRFIKLRDDEAEMFTLLVEHARAGTTHLQKFVKRQINQRKQSHLDLRNRVSSRSKIDEKVQSQYFSSWHFQAIRMLLTIPGHSTADQIASRLRLSITQVNDAISFLLESGLAKETESGYQADQLDHHLGKESVYLTRHHSNWRLHTIQKLQDQKAADLHYSAVVSMSDDDYQIVREIMLKSLNDSLKVIRPSKEKRLCVMAMDFYEI